MNRLALECVVNSLEQDNENSMKEVPSSRMRWYSLAEYLYSETLMKMVNEDKQERQQQVIIMFNALKHAVDSVHKADKAKMTTLVLDGSK